MVDEAIEVDDREALQELRALKKRLEELGRDYYAECILSREEYLANKREVDAKVAETSERIHVTPTVTKPGWADAMARPPKTWADTVMAWIDEAVTPSPDC